MADLGRHTLRAICAALVLACAPQAGSADLKTVDLSDLRAALRGVQADLAGGVDAPVDVHALWAKLPLGAAPVPDTAESTPPSKEASTSRNPVLPAPVLSAAPQQAARSVLTPAVPAQAGQNSQGGLFALQLSRTTTTPQAAAAPLPAPKPEAITPFQTHTPAASARAMPQEVVAANFRLMLATLSQTYTGRNAMAVVNAQGPRGPMAISVRAGTLTLADLHAHASALGMAPRSDGALTAPVVIWPEATLRLAPGEQLLLARDAGAFVLSLGTLDIEGALVAAVGPENSHAASFAPFVTVAGGGSLTLSGATLRNLGFGQTPKFSGLSVAGNLLMQNKGTVEIRNTLFDGVKRVSIAGTNGVKITGNTFINPGDSTLHLVNAAHAEIDNNLFLEGSHTNALRIEGGSIRAQVTRNIFLAGQRIAVMVSGRSDHVQMRDNLIWNRNGAGVKFLQTRCGLVVDNIILDNQQKGVEVRKSDGLVVAGNLIAGNRNAAIWISAQTEGARTAVTGNVLMANGAGLSAATGADIYLAQNDFAGQLPKLLEGDIARLSRGLITDLKGVEPLHFSRGKAARKALHAPLCGGMS